MLNQNCIAAFQRMGHPNLVFLEAEQKDALTTELSILIDLRMSLARELVDTKVKLLVAEGGEPEETFKNEMAQNLVDNLGAKSCAEFGYEGVYLD